ncbi:hydrolase [Bacilliculturomica massiliensis]|uniref:hydrolase n=1 Tax=Bacilliculturomica massiliensis TaxID=1917867 RepID=UPI0013EF49DF|nr:hydrolase [Bacilliculturomica massiliensis]
MVKRLKKDEALLVLIDFQERIMPAMEGCGELEDAAVRLVKGCRALGVPALVTQQYTKGLGATIPALHAALTEEFSGAAASSYTPVEKTTFSAMKTPEFVEALKASGRSTIIVSGIESHVCVQQTVIDLLDAGYTVFVAADCVSSRKVSDRRMAKSRMRAEGAVYTTMEAILFELCGGAREPGFKEISAIVK